MLKQITRNSRGLTTAEFGTLVSLVFTLALVLYLGLNKEDGDFYSQRDRNPDLLTDSMVENCLIRTRANDTVSPRQARPFNCFKLDAGHDKITLDEGDNIVYPGPGHDTVVADPGAHHTQIIYESGNDTYHAAGGNVIVDLRKFKRSDVSFDITYPRRTSIYPGDTYNPEDRRNIDVTVKTPSGNITLARQFDNHPITAIVFSDQWLHADELARISVSDQTTDGNDRITGTEGDDIISPGAGNDFVEALGGDDIIIFTSGYDSVDPGPGEDILQMMDYRSDEVTFSLDQSAEDIKVLSSPRNGVIMKKQGLYAPSSSNTQFSAIQFSDKTLHEQDILRRAVQDQQSDDNSNIYGSRFADIINPGLGRNNVYPNLGNNYIYHNGGNDRIHPTPGTDAVGRNTLNLMEFYRKDLEFSRSGDDLVIKTNKNSSVTAPGYFEEGRASPAIIALYKLKDEQLTDEIMHQLFFP